MSDNQRRRGKSSPDITGTVLKGFGALFSLVSAFAGLVRTGTRITDGVASPILRGAGRLVDREPNVEPEPDFVPDEPDEYIEDVYYEEEEEEQPDIWDEDQTWEEDIDECLEDEWDGEDEDWEDEWDEVESYEEEIYDEEIEEEEEDFDEYDNEEEF